NSAAKPHAPGGAPPALRGLARRALRRDPLGHVRPRRGAAGRAAPAASRRGPPSQPQPRPHLDPQARRNPLLVTPALRTPKARLLSTVTAWGRVRRGGGP